jgi:hypothetical protein
VFDSSNLYVDGLLESGVALAIVHKRKPIQELMQRGFLTICPFWWLALYRYLQFYWEEKLVVPLIAAPNGEYTTKKTKRKDKKVALDYRLCV